MPHSPPTIRHSPFFPHACSQYVLRRYVVTPTLNTAQHHDQKDVRLNQLSDCLFARRSWNAAFRVPGIGARVDSYAALHRRTNRV
jgi:hypothetical protein